MRTPVRVSIGAIIVSFMLAGCVESVDDPTETETHGKALALWSLASVFTPPQDPPPIRFGDRTANYGIWTAVLDANGVHIYRRSGPPPNESWIWLQHFPLEGEARSISMWEDILVVGSVTQDQPGGQVSIFQFDFPFWEPIQVLTPEDSDILASNTFPNVSCASSCQFGWDVDAFEGQIIVGAPKVEVWGGRLNTVGWYGVYSHDNTISSGTQHYELTYEDLTMEEHRGTSVAFGGEALASNIRIAIGSQASANNEVQVKKKDPRNYYEYIDCFTVSGLAFNPIVDMWEHFLVVLDAAELRLYYDADNTCEYEILWTMPSNDANDVAISQMGVAVYEGAQQRVVVYSRFGFPLPIVEGVFDVPSATLGNSLVDGLQRADHGLSVFTSSYLPNNLNHVLIGKPNDLEADFYRQLPPLLPPSP